MLCGSERKRQTKGGNTRKQYTFVEAYNEHIILEMEDIARKESEGVIWGVVLNE